MLSDMWKSRMKRPSRVFYSVSAQNDNLGDIAIRLRMLGWIRQSGAEVFVYTGPMSEEYLEAFDLSSDVTILRSKVDGFKMLLASLFRYRVFLVFPPGPSTFGGFKNTLRSLGIVAAIFAVSAVGGGAIQVGTSYRNVGRGGRLVHKYMTALLRMCVLRDVNSFAADSSFVAPDLAFKSMEIPKPSSRFRLSVSLRNDYNVNVPLMRHCKQLADENGWRLTFVTQVERDGLNHHRLADQLGADLVCWEGTHVEQFNRVKKAYAESVAVLTDRLHALIFSANSGAMPIALVHDGNDKLTSTFDHILDLAQIKSNSDVFPDSILHRVEAHSENPDDQRHFLLAAEEQLASVEQMTIDVLT